MQDWFVTDTGQLSIINDADEFELPDGDYRLYRFLTELEDLIATTSDSQTLLTQLCPMVRRLLMRSFWLQGSYREPDPDKGWSVEMLYDEPGFPLTIQMVAWQPGMTSPIHNHGSWGLVAILSGQEKNVFWRQTTMGDRHPLEPVQEHIFAAGDIVTFLPETIHHIEALGTEPVVSFNIYGETDYTQRFEFEPKTGTKTLF